MKLLVQDIPSRPPASDLAALRGLAVSDIADVLSDVPDRSTGSLRHMSILSARLLGPAFTVLLPPRDHLLLQRAIDLAQPGDVLVVQADGLNSQAAVVGEIMSRWARARGLAGFVIDGCIRDLDFISGLEWPVYARGSNPRGPTRVGPGILNEVVTVGGMTVRPGDVVCGDQDGLVCIPQQRLREVPGKVNPMMQRQREQIVEINDGSLDRSWIDQALSAARLHSSG